MEIAYLGATISRTETLQRIRIIAVDNTWDLHSMLLGVGRHALSACHDNPDAYSHVAYRHNLRTGCDWVFSIDIST